MLSFTLHQYYSHKVPETETKDKLISFHFKFSDCSISTATLLTKFILFLQSI